MSMIEQIADDAVWNEYYDNRQIMGHLSQKELLELRQFVDQKAYLPMAEGLIQQTYTFTIPTLAKINKGSTTQKRIIYQYQPNEMWVLKLLSYLMHRYDQLFCENCYSFRKNYSVRHAIEALLKIKNIDALFCLKVDIQNYFNSIPSDALCSMLNTFLKDDPLLFQVLNRLLSQNQAFDPGEKSIVQGNRGAMAGMPLSPFLANLYLKDVDEYFQSQGILYFRYADDVLLFANTLDELKQLQADFLMKIEQKGLKINEKKYKILEPGAPLEFLGIQYQKGIVDISDNTKKKLLAKIRRKARALYRWRMKKKTTFGQTAHVMIRIFNQKFYDLNQTGDFSWSKWFFPLINTDKTLKDIDAYLIQYIRFLESGRHHKGNYKITYEQLKELGFVSLVNAYYSRPKKA